MLTIIKFLHLMSLVVWIGGIIFFSFIAAPGIFKMLPRETAGDVVGDIFPKYWLMGYICSITALITIIILSFLERTYHWNRIGLLVVMVGITFYSGLVVGASAKDIKAQIRTVEDQSRKEALGAEFRSRHKISTILNSTILILGVVVIFFTARSLKL